MITTTQQSMQYNFPVISSLTENGKSLLRAKEISNQKQLSSRFEVVFPDFDSSFDFEIIKIFQNLESNNIIFYLKLSKSLIIKAILSGYWTQQKDPEFYLQKFDIELEKKDETPVTVFLVSTFWAMLSLGEKVVFSIPNSDFNFTNSFDLPLDEIGILLQERQIAYRLMVIEKALKTSLPFPDGGIDSRDIENITFCCNAIVEREFDWLCKRLTFFPLSTTEYSDLLPPTNSPFLLTFPTGNEKKAIFGRSINLGQLLIEIDQAVVANYEEAKQKFLLLNGEPVEIVVKSMNGKMRFKTINVPTLSKNAFSREIQKLIDLEEKLDSMYFEKYLNSFSNAFEGLTDEQIQAITERPMLEEEAFNF